MHGVTRAIVIAAPASGSGKTTIATGLIAALRRRGTTVAPFKVGPDYIDPGYHALAAGRPGRNLDSVLVGPDRIGPLFRHGAAQTDVAVVEGVMGLFDGRLGATREAEGSTARIAELLGAPVVLVVDARGHSQSLAAVLHGFATYRSGTRITGVVLNQVGSERHERVLRDACAEVGLPVLGALPRGEALAVPSRHLGLVTAEEHGGAAARAVDAMAELVARHLDLDAVLAAARPVSYAGAAWDPVAEVGAGTVADWPVIALARGAAFNFGYAEHAELLTAAGAEVVAIDPMRDEALPPGTAGVVLPGGFPEEHGAVLSANVSLRADVAALAAAGAPVHAECGGLLYLGRELDGHAMCGVLPAIGAMTPRLRLGYRDAVAMADSSMFTEGQRVTGHEFHRTALEPAAGEPAAWRWALDGVAAPPEGFVVGGVHASYLHTHPAGQPESVARFVARCSEFARVGGGSRRRIEVKERLGSRR